MNWVWIGALFAVTFGIHASGIVGFTFILRRFWRSPFESEFMRVTSAVILLIVVVALALAALHLIEAILWAMAYVFLGALPTFSEALLYSVDSMTTRGASGYVLNPHWRMIGSVEAGDGMLLFGISTAYLFAIMREIWASDTAPDHREKIAER